MKQQEKGLELLISRVNLKIDFTKLAKVAHKRSQDKFNALDLIVFLKIIKSGKLNTKV